jgi:hypothetical protein
MFPEYSPTSTQALMATLPGIDANDPAKTLATLKLYSAVLSSSPLVCDAHECGEGGLVPHPPSALNYWYFTRFILGNHLVCTENYWKLLVIHLVYTVRGARVGRGETCAAPALRAQLLVIHLIHTAKYW